MPVCAKCGQDNPDIAKFCLACGSPLEVAEAPRAPTDERKIVTAVFVDLVGSTARSEQLDVEDVKALIAPYHSAVRGELEGHGGTFEKFVGDAILVLFGAPVAHEDDPERAVRAVLAARKAVEQLNHEDEWLDLHIRIGVHTGEALVMLDARAAHGEWMAAGDVLNTAARIQSAAPTDGILVGELTYRATRAVIEYREVDPIAAKGKSEPLPVWEVVGEKSPELFRADDTPLIGREWELEELVSFLERGFEKRQPVLASVIGPAGIGKSRLLSELRAAFTKGCDILTGNCLSYGDGITYWPFEVIVKQAAGVMQDDDSVATAAKLDDLLQGLPTADRDELRTIAAALSNLMGSATTPQGTYSAVEIGRAELHWGIRRFLELQATLRPTLVVLEDLHWAEPTLLELVAFLTESGAGSQLAFLASARPEVKDSGSALFTNGRIRRALELEALSVEDSAQLVEKLALGSNIDKVSLETALRNAGGNPLFLEETVRMLAETGNGSASGGEALPVPSTLQALIASRLDQLQPEVKLIVQNASVIGTRFSPSAVTHLDGLRGDLAQGLAELERRDLVRAGSAATIAGEREYEFKHILIRDVAYGQLPKRRRAVLHARFAEFVETMPGAGGDYIEIVAYHLEQSCLLARAVARPAEPPPVQQAIAALAGAADKVERREGYVEAERLYTRALHLVGGDDVELRTELGLRRARMLSGRGDLRAAREQLTGAVEDAYEIGRRDLLCAGLLALANIDVKQGHAAEARPRLAEAELLAAQLGDGRLSVLVMFGVAEVLSWFDGEPEKAIVDLRRAIDRSEALGERTMLIEAHLRLATEHFNLGEFGAAEELLHRVIELSGELASFRDEVRATTLLGFVKYCRGELEEAERLAAQALEWLERTNEGYMQVQNLGALARYAIFRGELELAERRLQDGLAVGLELGGWVVIDIYRMLVVTLVRQGRVDDAAQLIVLAGSNVPEEDPYARAALLLGEAAVATARQDSAAASASFTEALRLLEEQQLTFDLAEAGIEFARALRTFGDLAAARTRFEEARAILARMQALTFVATIDGELAELGRGSGLAAAPPQQPD